MLKKNIAKAMAATTLLSTAAPMATAFADVVDNNQTEEIKAIKERAQELVNLRFTKKQNLLKADGLAGQKVLTVSIKEGDKAAVQVKNYDEFEGVFDKAYASLAEGEKIEVIYAFNTTKDDGTTLGTTITGYTKLEDGTVVDFAPVKLTQGEFNTDTAGATKKVVDNTNVDAGTIVYTEALDGSKTYEVKLSTENEKEERYINFEVGMDKLDLTKPVLRVVDGHYVDINGDAIKAVSNNDDITLSANDTLSDSDLDGKAVIDGFQLDQNAAAKTDLVKDVIVKEGHEVIEMTSTEMYNAAEGRLTKEGNEAIRKTDGLWHKNGLGDITYSIEKAETVKNKELRLTVFGTSATTGKKSKVVELIVTKDDADTRQVAYDALKDLMAGENQNHIITAAGNDRYETAVEMSRLGWSANSKAKVVLVSGANDALVDGLTATPLAAELDAPVLLTAKNELPESVINELKRLGTKEVYIVGGENSVSEEVEKTLKTRYGIKVNRVSGEGRYETSLEVAKTLYDLNDTAGNGSFEFENVFVVGGKGEADALSASAIAGAKSAPILLTPQNKLTADVELFLDKTLADDADMYVVGGTGSVSKEAYNSLLAINNNIKRLAGENRQDTNAAVIKEFALETDRVVMAKSNNAALVDALGAGALAAKFDAAVVLATNELTLDQEDALNAIELEKNTTNKVQAGYGISGSVASFIKSLKIKA